MVRLPAVHVKFIKCMCICIMCMGMYLTSMYKSTFARTCRMLDLHLYFSRLLWTAERGPAEVRMPLAYNLCAWLEMTVRPRGSDCIPLE